MTLASWALGMITVPGYTPLVLLLLLLSSLLLMCLGIVGSYVWRTYENSKARPSSLVSGGKPPDPQASLDPEAVVEVPNHRAVAQRRSRLTADESVP